MLRFFIITAEIIVLVLILRSPFVQYLFEDIQNSVSDWFISLSTLPEQRALESLRSDITTQLKPLKPYQQNYVEKKYTKLDLNLSVENAIRLLKKQNTTEGYIISKENKYIGKVALIKLVNQSNLFN